MKRRESRTVRRALRQLKRWEASLDRFYALRGIVHALGLLAAQTDDPKVREAAKKASEQVATAVDRLSQVGGHLSAAQGHLAAL